MTKTRQPMLPTAFWGTSTMKSDASSWRRTEDWKWLGLPAYHYFQMKSVSLNWNLLLQKRIHDEAHLHPFLLSLRFVSRQLDLRWNLQLSISKLPVFTGKGLDITTFWWLQLPGQTIFTDPRCGKQGWFPKSPCWLGQRWPNPPGRLADTDRKEDSRECKRWSRTELQIMFSSKIPTLSW